MTFDHIDRRHRPKPRDWFSPPAHVAEPAAKSLTPVQILLTIPWRCDHCHTPVDGPDAPCPTHGAPGPAGWLPF